MKKINLFLVGIIALFFMLPNTSAISVDSLFKADNIIKYSKEVDGSFFTAGNSITLKSKINGISFVAGNTLNVSTESDYSFIAGNEIDLKDIKVNDLFVAGNNILIDSEEIKRDVYAAGNNITINGVVGRNLSVGGETVTIDGTINGDALIDAENIVITGDSIIEGKLSYNKDAKVKISKSAKISKTEVRKALNVKPTFKQKLVSNLLSCTRILLLGLLLIMLFKKFFDKVASDSSIASSLGYGFLALVLIPIISVILCITSIGLSIGLILFVLYIIMIYLSTIFTGYYSAKRLLSSKINNDYILLFLGVVLIYVLRFVPYIGGLVAFLSLLFGMGITLKTVINLISNK